MTIAVAADHRIETENEFEVVARATTTIAKMVRVDATQAEPRRAHVEKLVAYHTSRGVPVRELADRCDRTLDRAGRHGVDALRRRRSSAPGSTSFWDAARRRDPGESRDDRPAGDPLEPLLRSPRRPPAPTATASRPRA